MSGDPSTATYAQTSVQLLQQLRRETYPPSAERVIRDAYRLAAELFSGYFTGTGRTQIAHVVGTASVVASLRVPAEVVAAALLHNAYETGDFGDGLAGVSAAHRRHVRRAAGAAIEEHVYRFVTIKRRAYADAPELRPEVLGTLHDPIDRSALLIVLADTVEHRLNHEEPREHQAVMAARAERLGFPALAAEIVRAFKVPSSRDFSMDLALDGWPRRGVIAPRSYRRKLELLLRQRLGNAFGRLRSRVSSGVRR